MRQLRSSFAMLSDPIAFCRGQVSLLKAAGFLDGETYSLEIADIVSGDFQALHLQALAHRTPDTECASSWRFDDLVAGSVVTMRYGAVSELNSLLPAVLSELGERSLTAFFCATAAVSMPGVPTFRIPFAQIGDAIQALRPHCAVFDAPISSAQFVEIRAALSREPLWVFFREDSADDNRAPDGAMELGKAAEPPQQNGRN